MPEFTAAAVFIQSFRKSVRPNKKPAACAADCETFNKRRHRLVDGGRAQNKPAGSPFGKPAVDR